MSDEPLHPMLARHLTEVDADLRRPPSSERWAALLDRIDGRYRAADAAQEDADRVYAELADARGSARAAQRAEKGRAQFVANMSHELRTPLNAILGYGEMLIEELDERDEPRLVEDVRRVQRAGRHLLGLINDLLDLAKIDAGRMRLGRERFPAAALLMDASDQARREIEEGGNHFGVEIDANLGSLTADPQRFRQCVGTLLSHAAKSTQAGTVTLKAWRMGSVVMVEVRDTGAGLTDEQQSVLFAEFEAEPRKSDGTGLGLALTRRLVELMGGAVEIDSEPGHGTTLRLRVPDLDGVRTEDAATLAAAAEKLRPGDDRVVLVIDDDPDVHDLVSRILAREGLKTAGATDGDRGIALAHRLRPRAIVLDLIMPGRSGWEILTRLKSDPELAHIPVVVLSTLDDRRRGLTLGADEYLVKPLDRVALLAAVRRHLVRADGDVLVVDDDFGTRRLMRRHLERSGLKVRCAAHGAEALDLVRERAPSLIVLDLMMPVMDGLTFLDHLRRDASFDGVPVLVTTGKDLSDEERARLEASVERVLIKDGRSLEAVLEQVVALAARSARTGPPSAG